MAGFWRPGWIFCFFTHRMLFLEPRESNWEKELAVTSSGEVRNRQE